MTEFNPDTLIKDAKEIAEYRIKNIALGVENDLKIYARKHRKTGDLLRNITLRQSNKKHQIAYIVDGGARINYRDKSYHPITFFVHDEGKAALTEVLRNARNKL